MVNIGAHTYGHEKIRIFYKKSGDLTIGKYCSIARGCRVFLGGNHRGEWISTYPLTKSSSYSKGDVTIGNDVWLAYGVIILSGVTIGDGAIVGAMSVVTKDIEPYAIACGNPAIVKRLRFKQNVIDKLLEVKWWDMDDKLVSDITPFLMSSDIDGLFNFLKGFYGESISYYTRKMRAIFPEDD